MPIVSDVGPSRKKKLRRATGGSGITFILAKPLVLTEMINLSEASFGRVAAGLFQSKILPTEFELPSYIRADREEEETCYDK